MKCYAVMVNRCVDGDEESGILGNALYADKLDAWKRMLEDAEATKNDINDGVYDSRFDIEIYANVDACSVVNPFETDYVSYEVVELEMK